MVSQNEAIKSIGEWPLKEFSGPITIRAAGNAKVDVTKLSSKTSII